MQLQTSTLISALEYISQVAQIWKEIPKGYIDFLYKELKDIYADEMIIPAVKELCRTTNLYGRYPTLKEWYDFCPTKRREKIAERTILSNFMQIIDYIIDSDPLIFNLETTRQELWTKFGRRAVETLRRYNGVAGLREQMHNVSQVEKEKTRREIIADWNSIIVAERTGVFDLPAIPTDLTKIESLPNFANPQLEKK